MRFLILFVAYLVSVVSAYDAYGAVERVVFYYAYLADAATNNGVPSTIARGCAKTMGVGAGNICNLAQLVAFVEGGNAATALDPNIPIDDPRPDVATASDAIYKSGHSGTYDLGRILNSIPSVPDTDSKMPGLYVGLMDTVKTYIYTADDQLLDRFQEAFNGALRGRMAAASAEIVAEAKVAVPGLDIEMITVPLYRRSGDSITVLNPNETKNAIGDTAGKAAFQAVLDANKTNTHTLIAKNAKVAAAKFIGDRLGLKC